MGSESALLFCWFQDEEILGGVAGCEAMGKLQIHCK
jgi:hypothetical protein